MPERWRSIPGYEDRYEVSDRGRVRSLPRSWRQKSRHGTYYTHTVKGKLLKPGVSKTNSGHLYVCLGRTNGKSYGRCVHELVLTTFVGPRPSKKHVSFHIDDDPTNNRLTNLRWATYSENISQAYRNGKRGVYA